jgi:3-oxosteroid 1-dehydrogenase
MILGRAHRAAVVVLGSGAAGLSAAIAARHAGASVTVLEATEHVGGTTALSGGVAWIPDNRLTDSRPAPDSLEAAETYLREISLGDVEPELVSVYLRRGPATLRRLAERTPVRWQVVGYPDYHGDRPGSRSFGRSVEACPVITTADEEAALRPANSWKLRITQIEQLEGSYDIEVSNARVASRTQTQGRALVAGLYQGAISSGVLVHTGVRATGLLLSDDAIA